MCRLNVGNVYCRFAENLLSSYLLYKNVKIEIYKAMILSVVSYWRETWSLKLDGWQRLRVCQNKALQNILGFKKEEVTEEKLHNVKVHDVYF